MDNIIEVYINHPIIQIEANKPIIETNTDRIINIYNGSWGAIIGDISNQIDLQNILNSKESLIDFGDNSQYWRGDKTWQLLDKNAVGLSNLQNLDNTNPENITQTSNYRFVTDTEKLYWDNKQDLLGFVPLNPSNNLSDLSNSSSARTNLGLGTLATQNGTFSGTSSGTNTGDISLGTPNGLNLSGQTLSLAIASAGVTGALSSTDWSVFNSKQPAIMGAASTVTSDNLPAFLVLQTDATGKIVTSSVSSAQLSYLTGVTSAIQTQLNNKQGLLSFIPFNSAGDTISANNGTGFIGLLAQSASPATPTSGFRLYANSSNALSWRGQNGFIRTFDGTANTGNRTYTLPDLSGTIALSDNLPNGTIINGICHIYQDSKPSLRPNGNALVVGDIWVSSSGGTAAFWDGLYWLSRDKKSVSTLQTSSVSITATETELNFSLRNAFYEPVGLKIQDVILRYILTNATDSNYGNIKIYLSAIQASIATGGVLVANIAATVGGNTRTQVAQSLNTYVLTTGLSTNAATQIGLSHQLLGGTTTIVGYLQATVQYRSIF